MKVQVNSWNAEQRRYESHLEARVFEDVKTIHEITEARDFGRQFLMVRIRDGEYYYRHLEGARASLHQIEEPMIYGYCRDDIHGDANAPLRRELWIILSTEAL